MGRVANAMFNNRVWRSVFRHGYPNNPRNRAEVMFQNVFLHVQPVKVFKRSLKVTTTFGLGLTLSYLFLLLTLTGFLLMFYYIPHVDRAYQDMKDLEFAVSFGVVLRNMHRWGAHGMVAFTFLHMARVFYTGAYKAPREFNWFVGIILLIVTLFLSLSGLSVAVGSARVLGDHHRRQPDQGDPAVGHRRLRCRLSGVLVHFWRIRKDGGLARPDEQNIPLK